jgi:hypothetical protein
MFRHVTTRFAGLVILIAGLWGGLVPFIGPAFHFALGPNHSWTWTSGRFYLSVLPAFAAIVGGLLLLGRGPRASGRLGALLALAGGVWFAIGPTVSLLWATDAYGLPHGAKGTRILEMLTYHTGLGVLIATFAAYALPGVLAYRREVAPAAAGATGVATGAAAEDVAARRGRFGASAGTPATEPTAATGAAAPAGTATRAEADGAATEPVARRRWFGLLGRRAVRT